VEYLYAPAAASSEGEGDSTATVSEWGRLRAQDGHPEPYNISWFEIGAAF
jgi:hypothetical protein